MTSVTGSTKKKAGKALFFFIIDLYRTDRWKDFLLFLLASVFCNSVFHKKRRGTFLLKIYIFSSLCYFLGGSYFSLDLDHTYNSKTKYIVKVLFV